MAQVLAFDKELHEATTVSHEGKCAQGGQDTCHQPAEFSVIGEAINFDIAACGTHLAGAVRHALGLPARH
jgi:hypothetical protein